ncbi:MAG: hormogonium polysaccharide biosynthesis protein HpsA [Cyanobacteria bacterium P01_A01_bin.135]
MSNRRHQNGARSRRWRSAQGDSRSGGILAPLARLLLRILFALPRRLAQPQAQAGFILPTVVLLLLVVSLTVGSITLRTFTRTSQAIGDRQQQIIYNAASPAIDRARAKLEYLFNQDERLPSGIPGEDTLFAMMTNDTVTVAPSAATKGGAPANPYLFDDEAALNITNAATVDNAWQFPADSDGDGTPDTLIAYSIVFQTPRNPNDLTNPNLDLLARNLEVRNGPLSSAAASGICSAEASSPVQEGWFSNAGSTVVNKNFQINAIAVPGEFNGGQFEPNPLGTVATLEFQQDRQINQGNKWGAWFRNDLEVFPGPQFRWNGAMHTEGNFVVGESARPAAFNAFLISSTGSCLNTSAIDSEITMGRLPDPDDESLGDNGGEPFVGQVISGRVVTDTNTGETSRIHLFNNGTPISNAGDAATQLTTATDSVAETLPVSELALDPIRLLAEDVSAYRNPNRDSVDIRDANWPVNAERDGLPAIDERIGNQSEPLPRVGDSYRADNRLGPQPRYAGRENNFIIVADEGNLGENIDAGTGLISPGAAVDEVEIGLDGYWERRARNQGMRIVVGQRLELGDPYGWDGANESLYPFATCTPGNLGCHTTRQRRTLLDNLAAVQATAIYRAGDNATDGDLPRACLATTVHPGTAKTLRDSATFETLQIPPNSIQPAETTVLTDFFTGRGTNGWEFDFPYTASDIATATNRLEPMGIALRNLAKFAGDPRGGAPSFPPVQDANVHPFPLMAMWGDFSKQRRVLDLLDGAENYASLSPADKTTLHTAICTLSMLAYNINYLSQFRDVDASLPAADQASVNLEYGSDGDDSIRELANRLTRIGNNAANLPASVKDLRESVEWNPLPEQYIAALEEWNSVSDPADPPTDRTAVPSDMLAIARVIANREQVNRDRIEGFSTTGTRYSCRFNNPALQAALRNGLNTLCADPARPKYPVLRALFPAANDTGNLDTAGVTRDTVLPYFAVVNGDPYEPITGDTEVLPPTGPEDQLTNLATTDIIGRPQLSPTAGWTLPIAAATGVGENPNSNEAALIAYRDATGTTTYRVPFKDAAFYDGRERMSIRALDIDLDLLRQTRFATAAESWLPLSGIVFAFREDAVREDAIVRPAGSAVQCANFAVFTPANCQTDAQGRALSSTDPLILNNGFSMKAVDFIADPDRRPYGFRIFNGTTLRRADDDGTGMSLVSDNSVYIKGPFNLHQLTGTATRLEEFTVPLDDDWANFYDRRSEDLDTTRFANPARDDWRPTEVLADAVTILSNQFCDGSIEDSFTTAGENPATANVDAATMTAYGCANVGGPNQDRTSYLNQKRPINNPGAGWQRQNPLDNLSPIAIDRNGNPLVANGTGGTPYTNNFYDTEENALSVAAQQTVNLGIIGAIVPSREDQPYGGLHNFPRLLEDWDDVDLSMSGTFFQLTFSTAATAPYDQEVWERQEAPTRDRDIFPYYNPPQRLWGYDVALQYVQAPPIASRFASPNTERSEFYSEPTLDDPYIAQLCRSAIGNASFCPAP